jgi:hypothetical protein
VNASNAIDHLETLAIEATLSKSSLLHTKQDLFHVRYIAVQNTEAESIERYLLVYLV